MLAYVILLVKNCPFSVENSLKPSKTNFSCKMSIFWSMGQKDVNFLFSIYPLIYSFLMFAIISVITMCFYGLSFNSGKQDLFKGTGLMAGVEVLAYFIILFTIDIAGRRPVLSFCQIFAGLSCLCSGFVPAEYFWPRFGFDQVVSSLKSSNFRRAFTIILIGQLGINWICDLWWTDW